jgi:hypothetical protein
MEDIMARHNTPFLNMFRQMIISFSGPGMEKVLRRTSPQGPNGETGESSAVVKGQPPQDASAQPPQQSVSSQPIQQNPHQAMPIPRKYGEMAFGTSGVPPGSTYRIAPSSNRLQKNMYGNGYSEYMDYSAIDALPNPRYGATTGMSAGGPGNQDTNIDLLV